MPYEFKLDRDKEIAIRRSWGMVDDEETMAARDEFLKFSERGSYHELYDFREVTEYRVSPETIQRLAQEWAADEKESFSDNRVAIVVRGDLSYGMQRIYKAYHENAREAVKLFTDYDAALKWLTDG